MMQRLTFPFPFVHHQTHDWLLSVLEWHLCSSQKERGLMMVQHFLGFKKSVAWKCMESGTTINRGNENLFDDASFISFPRCLGNDNWDLNDTSVSRFHILLWSVSAFLSSSRWTVTWCQERRNHWLSDTLTDPRDGWIPVWYCFAGVARWEMSGQEKCPAAVRQEKERCSGSFHLAVGFLVIKDDSISERLG